MGVWVEEFQVQHVDAEPGGRDESEPCPSLGSKGRYHPPLPSPTPGPFPLSLLLAVGSLKHSPTTPNCLEVLPGKQPELLLLPLKPSSKCPSPGGPRGGQ